MPGYIKNVGDHIRMRWVQPGYDPDSEGVPPNKVIFDSDDLGALSVLASGKVSIPIARTSYTQLVTWDLDYVPLCWIQFDTGNGYVHNHGGTSVSVGPNRVNIRKTGIWYKGFMASGASLVYTAFRIKAADG